MNLLILIVVFTILLVHFFFHSKANIMSPIIAYLVPFEATLIIAYFFRNTWHLELSDKTFFVVLLGTIGFSFGVLAAKNRIIHERSIVTKSFSISNGRHLFFLGLQIIFLLISILYTISNFGSNFVLAMGVRREALGVVDDPIYISLPGAISLIGGTIYGLLLADALVKKKKNGVLFILLNYIISFFVYLVGGSRGGALILIFAFVCPLVVDMFSYMKRRKILLIYILIVVLFLFLFSSFQQLTLVQGKIDAQKYTFWEYMSVYCGAEIKNLDTVIREFNQINPVIGYSCFKSFFKLFGFLGVDFSNAYDVTKIYHSVNGVQLGNTHTIYGQTVIDFGVLGSTILMFIVGYFSKVSFNTYRYSFGQEGLTITKVFYPWIYYSLFFSFFAAKIFSEVICVSMIKYVFCYLLIKYILYGYSGFSKGRIKLQKISRVIKAGRG